MTGSETVTRLQAGQSGVQIPAKERNISVHQNIHINSEAHPDCLFTE
jgi:hypothetical protein